MYLDRLKLAQILSILNIAVGNKILNVSNFIHFSIDREKNQLLLSTTDFHLYLTINYGDLGADMNQLPDIFMIDFKSLFEIVKSSTTELITFSKSTVNEHIAIDSNGSYRFATYKDTSEFPLMSFANSGAVTIEVPELYKRWTKAAIAVSKDVTKLSYQGVNFDGNFVATDNARLAVAKCHEYNGKPFLIPPSFGELLKNCKNTIVFGLNESGSLLIVQCEEVALSACVRLIDAAFVDYKIALNTRVGQDDFIRVSVPKQELVSALSRLMIFSDKLYKTVKLTIAKSDDGTAYLILDIDNKNSANEQIEIVEHNISEDIENNTTLVTYNYHVENVIDGVSVVEGEFVQMTVMSDGKVWIDEEDFSYLLTVIR